MAMDGLSKTPGVSKVFGTIRSNLKQRLRFIFISLTKTEFIYKKIKIVTFSVFFLIWFIV